MFALNRPEIRIECEMEGQPDEDRHSFVQVHLKDAWCDFSVYNEDCDPGEGSRLGWLYIEKLAFTLSKASFNNFCSLSLPKEEDSDFQLNRHKGEIQVSIEEHGDNVGIAISPFRCLI